MQWTKNNFHYLLNPERKVSEKALEVHGYTDKFLSDKKKFKDIVDEFLSFIKDKRLIIHNAEFDLAHLNNELKILGKEIVLNSMRLKWNLKIDEFKKLTKNLSFN